MAINYVLAALSFTTMPAPRLCLAPCSRNIAMTRIRPASMQENPLARFFGKKEKETGGALTNGLDELTRGSTLPYPPPPCVRLPQ